MKKLPEVKNIFSDPKPEILEISHIASLPASVSTIPIDNLEMSAYLCATTPFDPTLEMAGSRVAFHFPNCPEVQTAIMLFLGNAACPIQGYLNHFKFLRRRLFEAKGGGLSTPSRSAAPRG